MSTSKIKFTKMHGLGNDFVVIDGREMDIQRVKNRTQQMARRGFGIGCDQILVLRKSRQADFRMQIFNADGSEVEMCGNGIRCLARYLHEKNITKKKEIRFETLGGIISTKFKEDNVEVDMGPPILDAPRIQVNLQGRVFGYKLAIYGREFAIHCVSMGNPHCVIFVDSVDALDVARYGPAIENHPLFPNRINVEFVEILAKDRLKMRVWERGAGETHACGTGACATAVASRIVNKTDAKVVVELQGGNLEIRWEGEGHSVFMTGPAATVYQGVMEF